MSNIKRFASGDGSDMPPHKRGKREEEKDGVGPVRTSSGTVCGAEIDEDRSCAPVAGAAGPAVPGSLFLSRSSIALLTRGTVNNAFTGVAHIRTGEIFIYPLADEAYWGGDRQFSRSGDGYATSRFPGGLPAGSIRTEDTPARPLPPGGTRARSMSQPGPARHVAPITHMDATWEEEVSHEQMARRAGGVRLGELTAGDQAEFRRSSPGYPDFVGFTVWVGPRADTSVRIVRSENSVRSIQYGKGTPVPMQFRLVCTSRALNTPHFRQGGKMSRVWALALKRAFDNARMPMPRSADDSGIRKDFEFFGT